MEYAEDHAITMDDEKLICEVKEHPCLFKTKCTAYKIQIKKETKQNLPCSHCPAKAYHTALRTLKLVLVLMSLYGFGEADFRRHSWTCGFSTPVLNQTDMVLLQQFTEDMNWRRSGSIRATGTRCRTGFIHTTRNVINGWNGQGIIDILQETCEHAQ